MVPFLSKKEKQMKKILNEFKTFIAKDNVIDLAIGVIIGGAFITAIINFFLVAIVLFFIVKLIIKSRETAEKVKLKELEKYYEKHPDKRPVKKEEVHIESQEDILKEIRDLLKKK